MLHGRLLVVYIAILCWTVFFACAISAQRRGYRNVGILALVVVGLVAPFIVGFTPAAVTWMAIGLVGGLLYFAWELWSYYSEGRKIGEPFPALDVIFQAIVLWPIMIPEAFEYFGAALRLLKTRIERQE
jgi:O-antigen/teichoic acid export membrane protein